ncbi:MAG TPA: tetratricopeptide repeat protein [Thermoanaerobaculia bacterium]|nr:tetratricopeptide repeat protein [Thermoanaerobaculia bacterium]
MNAPTDWGTAVAILAAGLILGVLFVYLFNKRKKTFSEDLVLKDLQAKRDALVQQLRDPGVEGDERTRLEVETAQVLRQLDAYKSTAPASEAAAPAAAMDPTVKGFLWGASSVGVLVALGYFVMQQATPREEGGSLTGGFESGAQQQQQQQQQPPTSPMIQQLEAAVQKDPNNLELRNDLAQAYLQANNMMAVFEQTKFVLEKKPDDSRALTFQALVRMAMGDADAATQMLQRATQSNPKNLDGWVSLAWIYVQTDRMADAERMIAEAVKQSPGDKAQLENVFASMKQSKNGQPAQTAEGLPEGHPPVDGGTPAPPTPSTPAATGPSVRVTLNLDAAAKSRSGVLFVIARNPAGGPPVAAKRVMVSSFPMTVELSAADSMMGQPLPPKFRLEARLDSDGDAMTRVPTDPSAMQEGVSVGSAVTLALK